MIDEVLRIKLENNPLMYRDKLTIPDNINFGLELELDKIKYDEVYKVVRKKLGDSWIVKKDKSLTEGENAEIVSPVLQNNKETWILLKKVGEILKSLNPTYNNCSFQVNFDGELLPTLKDKARFLKLYAMYEDIIYRFSKGEDLEYRNSLEMYAYPIMLTLKGLMYLYDDDIVNVFTNNKRYGIIFKQQDKELIEFRTPNMTSNIILWQNYITTFYYLIEYASSIKHNCKELDDYINCFQTIYVLQDYETIKLDKAKILSKNIFHNSIDQNNFMCQYLQKFN